LTLPAREGDLRVFGQRPSDEVNADHWGVTITNLAPHANVRWQRGALNLALGMRLETYALAVSRVRPQLPGVPAIGRNSLDLYPDPRIDAIVTLRPNLRLEARGAVQHQAPAASDLSSVFGTPALHPARSIVGSLGPSVELPFELQLRMEGYAKALSNLARRSDDPTPPVAQALVQRGTGWTYGASVLLQRQPASGLGVLASYGISRSTRTGPHGLERLFDFDQTHVLSTSVSYRRGEFLGSARFRYATGSPRTPVLGAYLDSKSDAYEPILGAINSVRLPAFMQLDVHAEYGWRLGASYLALYGDVLNATAHVNVEQVAYSADFSHKRDIPGLPLLALLGVRLGF
jgi:hypothetical protein